MRFNIYLSFFLLLFVFDSNATRSLPMDRQDIISQSAFIGRIKIESGGLFSLNNKNEAVSCGYMYKAKAIEAILGSVEQLTFQSYERLTLGNEYLVFLSSETSKGEVVVSTNSFMIGDLKRKRDKDRYCDNHFSGLKDIQRTSSEFLVKKRAVKDGSEHYENWIGYSGAFYSNFQEYKYYNFEINSYQVSDGKTSNKVTPRELLDTGHGHVNIVPPHFPEPIFESTLFRWKEIKEILSINVKKLNSDSNKHNKPIKRD